MAAIPSRLPSAKRFGDEIADLERKEYEALVDARAEK